MIIGEAVKRLPIKLTKSEPDIPWMAIKGIRNRLVHDYYSTDYKILREIIVNEIEDLKLAVMRMLQKDSAR